MKIVCESCSAKYSIADEKVAGRVFKIRCKKCGAAIVVRGDQVDGGASGDAEEASTRVHDYGGDAVWHIVIDGEQQGPYAPSQLGEMLSAGTIGWDAFVWREGFDDWKAAQDIEELVQAIMGGGQQGAEMGADPFAATQHAASADPDEGGFAAPPAARKADAGADLFAQTDAASPFGAGGGDEDDDVVASSPSPRVSADQALTGARNENSVLFSLSNLQALATGPGGGGGSASSSASSSLGGPSISASPKPGMAAGEGSGLIDIRALASATGVTPGSSGPITSASNDRVDDLLSIGGAGVGGLGSSLGAPVLIPEKKEESNKGVIIAAIAAVAVVAIAASAIAAVMIMNGNDGETPVAAAGTVSPGQTVAAVPGATPALGAQPADPTQAQPAQPAEPTAQAVGAAPPPQAAEAPPASEGSGERERDRGSRDRPRTTGGGGGGGGGGESRAAAPANDPPARRSGGGGGDIDDLLNQALEGGGGGGGGRRQAAAPAPSGGGGGGGGASSGPQTPSRSDIMSAMGGVQGAVRACGNGAHGNATVRVSFAGSSGRATGAEVNSALPGPVKSCIAAAVRRARVPPFQQNSFSVNYPFSL